MRQLSPTSWGFCLPLDQHGRIIDGSSRRNPPERCPSPLYSQDCPEENHNVPEDHQVENLIDIKVEIKDEAEEETDLVAEQQYVSRRRKPPGRCHGPMYSQDCQEAASRTYRRMHINVNALISEVQARRNIWDKQIPGYSNRTQRQHSWEEICVALYPDWVTRTNKEQGEIEKDLQNRWKSVRDRFQRHLRQAERSGSAPSQVSQCPYHQQLLFLLPNRALRQSSGNVERRIEECPAAQEEQQQSESEPPPSTSHQESLEAEPHSPDDAGPSWVSTAAQGAEETSAPPAAVPLPVATPTHPPLPTRSPSTRQQSRRTLRTMDRQLEVETNAMSFIRRVNGDDDFDYFGYAIASRCRQMQRHVGQTFISYVHAVVAAFEIAVPLPPLEELVYSLHTTTGLRDPSSRMPHSPRSLNASTQTEMPNPPSSHSIPSAGSQFLETMDAHPPS
ncbi:uncharacterized protein LOC142667560 isoform X2 [Rhinoderma darwinii]|uniref:uncharacterized protein LOC142667560 isoform X2 n=1 Tax=Rhinoderma darwinii TaxID=43563 RepID=UPI003F6776E6